MNRIDDERIKFYLEHEDRIKEWAAIKKEVAEFAHRFYVSLRADVDEAIRENPDWKAESIEEFADENSKWPLVGLRRTTWPYGAGEFSPKIVIEWNRPGTGFSGWLVCGAYVGDHVEEPKRFDLCVDSDGRRKVVPSAPVLKEYPKGPTPCWFRWRSLQSPHPGFWEGDDGLVKYRKQLLDKLLQAWTDLAPLMDEAAKRAHEAAKRADDADVAARPPAADRPE